MTDKDVTEGYWIHKDGMLICSACGTMYSEEIMMFFGNKAPDYCAECWVEMKDSRDKS